MYTNVNIISSEHKFHYVFEYNSSYTGEISGLSYSYKDGDIIFGCDKIQNDYIPSTYKLADIMLYFPSYNLDVYEKHVIYRVDIYTWICGKKVILKQCELKHIDALAASRIRTFNNEKYYECISIPVIDPKSLIYDDIWQEFRTNICGELQSGSNLLNSTGSSLGITLHPYQVINGEYLDVSDYYGGQGSINISKEINDYLSLDIYPNTDQPLYILDPPGIVCKLSFNPVYNNSLRDYIKETYGVENFSIQYKLIIGNKDDLYLTLNSNVITTGFNNIKPYIFTKKELTANNFKNGNGFVENMLIRASMDIIENGEPLLTIMSNSIPLTTDLYKYLVGDKDFTVKVGKMDTQIYNVKLNEIDMDIYNINTVNKITHEIVQITREGGSRSDMVHPVFFKSYDLSDIIIHPKVNETIAINLDAYKSRVSNFYIKIGDTLFPEIGRTTAGVLFKLTAVKLSNIPNKGTYYILNEDVELVSTGKYIGEY